MMRQLLAAGALALTVTSLGAGSAQAQVVEVDPRWQAWVGCWAPLRSSIQEPRVEQQGLVCVVPAEGRSAVDIVAVVDGAVATRERIDATGEPREATRNGCTGSEQAEWSADGLRVYLGAAHSCAGGAQRRASGMLAFTAGGHWLDVQSVAVGAHPGVRVVRYREVDGGEAVPEEIARAIAGRGADSWAIRAAAGGAVGAAEVIEAAGHLDGVAIESWLVERGDGFDLNAERLVELSGQGVPDRVIDVMVALSYPGVFTVTAAARGSGARVDSVARPQSEPSGAGYGPGYDDRFYSPFGWSPYGYGYGGYGYSGWYSGGRPIIIVVNPPAGGGGGGGTGGERHGKVVNGRGYAGGDNTGPRARPSNPGSTGSGSVSSGSGGSSQPQPHSSGSSGSGSSTSTGRTAHPRP